MRRFFLCLVLFSHALSAHNFWDWQDKCSNLKPGTTCLSWEELKGEAHDFRTRMTEELAKARWLADRKYRARENETFVQKRSLDPQSVVIIHGDLHGDIHSINRLIAHLGKEGVLDPEDPFHIRDPNTYLLFLGDYVDRGSWGCEVLYTILKLKNSNWDQVMLVRGNHEEVYLNHRYGFAREFQEKFAGRSIDEIQAIYEYMPAALFLGCKENFVLCCHGGLEIGHDPKSLLDSSQEYEVLAAPDRKRGFSLLCNEFSRSRVLEDGLEDWALEIGLSRIQLCGYLWSDFSVNKGTIIGPTRNSQQMFKFGELATKFLLDRSDIRCVLRAHQHSVRLERPMMRRILNRDSAGFDEDAGLGKLWDQGEFAGSLVGVRAVTFCVSPVGGKYKIPWDPFGKLTLASQYEDWRLEAVRLEIESK